MVSNIVNTALDEIPASTKGAMTRGQRPGLSTSGLQCPGNRAVIFPSKQLLEHSAADDSQDAIAQPIQTRQEVAEQGCRSSTAALK